MSYIQHFGDRSKDYKRFRPDYPKELFEFLIRIVDEHDQAWDCGTGNGQAAAKLAEYFYRVIATDINEAQLDFAIQKENILYYAWPAEKTEIAESSINLITVAQALHWFNFHEFFQEVRRVAKPNGVIAAWCYSLGYVQPNVDVLIKKLYSEILSPYWPKERQYIDEEYKTIPFPFYKFKAPTFKLEKKMNFAELIGYLNTWSAVKEYEKKCALNPLDLVYSELSKAWGDPLDEYIMHWPIHMLIGRVS